VAGGTLPLGIGGMGELEALRQCGVAGEAEFRRTGLEQVGVVGGVRIVTSQAFPLAHRLMDDAGRMPCGFRVVAGITEFLRLLLEQARETGDMGAVTGAALPAGDRRVLDPLLEGRAVMTGEAVDSRQGCPLDSQQQAQGGDRNENAPQRIKQRHHCALPS